MNRALAVGFVLLANSLSCAAEEVSSRALAAPGQDGYVDSDGWILSTGYCYNYKNQNQNDGEVKLNNDQIDTDEKRAECLALCKAYEGATGCQANTNRGCYAHTKEVSGGGGQSASKCWVDGAVLQVEADNASKQVDGFEDEDGWVITTGYCYDLNNNNQNDGEVKLNNDKIETATQRADCLAACKAYEGARGCQANTNRGCYVHTGEVSHGGGQSASKCWVDNKILQAQLAAESAAAEKQVENYKDTDGWIITTGYCYNFKNQNQNDGEVKLYEIDDIDTAVKRAECLEACKAHPGATGCQANNNGGCYAHTKEVSHGGGQSAAKCWVDSAFLEAEAEAETRLVDGYEDEDGWVITTGYCYDLNNNNQNDGEVKLYDDKPDTAVKMEACLAACKAYSGSTGCQANENNGCYVHTGEVSHGGGQSGSKCWVNNVILQAELEAEAAAAALQEEGYKDSDGWIITSGYCYDYNDRNQNDGEIRLYSDDVDTAVKRAACLAACKAYEGATGCQANNDGGCFAHTKEVSHGGGQVKSKCWVDGAILEAEAEAAARQVDGFEDEDGWVITTGYCYDVENRNQNDGEVKLYDEDIDTAVKREECLEACKARDGATGCQANRDGGCYVHTEIVAYGGGQSNGKCWVKKSVLEEFQAALKLETDFNADADGWVISTGYCYDPNNRNQDGEVKLYEIDEIDTPAKRQECLAACKAFDGATGCQANESGGCFAHTKRVSHGGGQSQSKCWVKNGANLAAMQKTLNQCLTAKIWGDPHIVPFGKRDYDCHGQGEFIVIQTKDQQLKINSIFETGTWKNGATVANMAAFQVDEDIPAIQATLPKYVTEEGCPYTFTVGDDPNARLPTEDITTYFDDEDKIKVFRYGPSTYSFIYGRYGTKIDFAVRASSTWGCTMSMTVCVVPEMFGGAQEFEGLLGTPDGDPFNDWVLKNDGGILDPFGSWQSGVKKGTDFCVENWCVGKPSHSMFPDEIYEKWTTCTTEHFDPDGLIEEILNDPNIDTEQCEENIAACSDAAAGGPAEAALNQAFNDETTKIAALPVVTLSRGSNSTETPETPLIFEPPPACLMSTDSLTNPSCPDEPVAVFTPMFEGQSAPPRSLLYDFVFDDDGEKITFKVWNEVGQVSSEETDVYVQHRSEDGFAGEYICSEVEPECVPDEDPATVQTVTAQCRHTDQYAVVTLAYILRGDDDQGFASTPGSIYDCCHAEVGTNPVVQYTYVIHCGCPVESPEETERLLRGSS